MHDSLISSLGLSITVLYAVLADIHGNLHALNAVLDDIQSQGADEIVCLGDIVGYGAYPKQCTEVVRDLCPVTVAGNHDWGVVGKVDIEYFNADARDSVEWTREQVAGQHVEYLRNLGLLKVLDDLTIVHSSLFAPEYFDYIQTLYDVQLNFKHLGTAIGFVGHSHVPVMFLDTDPVDCFLEQEFCLPPGKRALVNVGSVGQPRDLIPLASYALYDSGARKVRMQRVEYDVQAAAQDIINAGLPTTNAARLILGR
jgi:predicted phosphodiesterase